MPICFPACRDASTEEILKNVRTAVDAFVGEAEQFDDLTMMCVEYRGPAKKGLKICRNYFQILLPSRQGCSYILVSGR